MVLIFNFFRHGLECKALLLIILLKILSIQEILAQNLSTFLNGNLTTSADTITLALEDAESIFLKHNLRLLAQKMNIEEARAQVIQSRLWDNPTLYLETNPRNQISNRYFSYGTEQKDANGNYIGNEITSNIDQIIKTAGKRSNLVKLNKINVEITEDDFYDLIRTLKFNLRSDYYLLLQFQQAIELLQSELNSLNFLIHNISIQVNEGNMPLKDLLRIQALAFDVENSIRDFITQRSNAESELKTILGLPTKAKIIALKDTNKLKAARLPSLDSLAVVAIENRFDLKAAIKEIEAAERNFKLQRSLAYPDLDVGVTYTRYSNYIPNYYGVLLRMSLPAWNRNQGNIKTAEYSITEQKAIYENQLREALNDLSAAYIQFIKYQSVYTGFNKSFENKYDLYFQSLTKNYEQHIVGLLEFIDFFESYRDTKIAAFNLEQDFLQAKEQLNYSVGKDLFK
ncbi:MAG TPA: TolC family protein [Cytophagaceae bacterium]|jgi:cobalt-zinc-cadmium efflux system outer membrane protein|nr:TolC family protein [Cytophagaceae bacterium]